MERMKEAGVPIEEAKINQKWSQHVGPIRGADHAATSYGDLRLEVGWVAIVEQVDIQKGKNIARESF